MKLRESLLTRVGERLPLIGLPVATIQLAAIAVIGEISRYNPEILRSISLEAAALGIFTISWLSGFGLLVALNRQPHSPTPNTTE